MMLRSARQLSGVCRAFLFAGIVLSPSVSAQVDSDYRLAAVIYKGPDSMALIETTPGEQAWFRVGDTLGAASIDAIDADGILLSTGDGQTRLDLSGDSNQIVQSADATTGPSPFQSKEVQFLGLLSRINAVDRAPGETYDQALTRTMNRVLGFGASARITEVNRVKVSSPGEAHQALQQRLAENEIVQITVEGDAVKSLYVVPE
jgi:hypothetical protein